MTFGVDMTLVSLRCRGGIAGGWTRKACSASKEDNSASAFIGGACQSKFSPAPGRNLSKLDRKIAAMRKPSRESKAYMLKVSEEARVYLLKTDSSGCAR